MNPLARGLQAAIADYQSGDPLGLLLTIEKALRAHRALNDAERTELYAQLADDLKAALNRHATGEAATLDEVFGTTRPKHWNRHAHRKAATLGVRAALAARALIEQGHSTNYLSFKDYPDPRRETYAFAVVARRLNLSSAWVRDRYYEVFPRRSRNSAKRLEP